MKIISNYPPNIEDIKQAGLEINEDSIFCYGDTIFNPSGKEIAPEILYHENIHIKQQGDNPEYWWMRYLADREFRKQEEVEAYAGQYQWIKKHTNARYTKNHLLDIAEILSSKQYNLGISASQAETMVRKYAL